MARILLNSIEELIELINREKSHLESVREIESTHHEFLGIQSCLKDGVDGGPDEKEVERWKELQQITHEAEYAIVKYLLGTARLKMERSGKRKEFLKKFHRSWNPLFQAHKKITKEINRISKPFEFIYHRLKYCQAHNEILKEMQRITELIKKLKDDSSGQCYSRVQSFDDLSDWNLLRSSVVFDEAEEDDLNSLVGLGHDIDYLKQLLSGDGTTTCVISVLGILGIGKTKLAWEIYKSSDFTCKAWVCASAMNINDWRKILEDISTQINYIESQQQGKRCLIVIDDVGDPKISEKLQGGEIAPGVGSGSRIILTTRDVEVASYADYSHRMKVLSKVESWELFTSKLFIAPWQQISITESGGILPPELDVLGRKMVEKCGGIPYLIIDLENILSAKRANIMEWSCVLHGTDTHLTQNQHHWFNLSCFVDDILPSHVRQFLRLFPTGIKIPERRLFLSWAAEGYWQQKSKSEKVVMQPSWVQDLQDLNLIHASKVSSLGITKSYRISPDLPLLQILKAADGAPGGSSSSSPDDDSDSKVWIHRIADNCESKGPHFHRIHGNVKSSRELKPYRTLSFFWCFNYPGGYKPGQELGKFLKNCINSNYLWFLRVLDLEGVYKPRLPTAIGELFNLRYLGLRWTYLDTLPPSVDRLQNLQTLDTKHTDIGYYPWIGYLENVKQLYLNERHQSELVTQLSHLTDLQTLSGVIVDDSSHVNKRSLEKMTNLTKLRLTCRLSDQQQQEAMAKWIGELKNLETLKLNQREEQPFLWKDLMMKNTLLSRLYLQGRLENLIHHNDSGLNLTALTLSLTKLATDPMPVLGKLPKLKLLRLFFDSFTGDSMCCSPETFRQLRVLKIWKLKNLQKLTIKDKAMPMLEELEIRSCEKMLEMLQVPKTLRKLKLTNMPNKFTSDVTGNDYQNVSYVNSVIVEDWPSHSEASVKLYTGPSSVFHQAAIEELLDLDAFKLDLTELSLFETKLKQDPMPELEKLPKLRTLVLSSKSFIGNHMVFSTGGFKELQKLTIRELEVLEELTVENGAMPKLEELEISSCKNLKVLPQVLETLKKLKLVNMPKESTEKLKADKRVIVKD